jgi:tetratricopeptide (TPR) repeat protein
VRWTLEQCQASHGIGSIHFARGDLTMATEMYAEAARLREALEPDASELAMTCENMASIYRVQGKLREAFMACHKSCRIRERRASLSSGQLVLTGPSTLLTTLAAIAAGSRASESGGGVLAKPPPAVTLTVGTPTAALLDVATSYNNVGLVLRSMGKVKEAHDAFVKCLALREKYCASPSSAELLAVRANIASVQQQT